jgi:hypothetical protein
LIDLLEWLALEICQERRERSALAAGVHVADGRARKRRLAGDRELTGFDFSFPFLDYLAGERSVASLSASVNVDSEVLAAPRVIRRLT